MTKKPLHYEMAPELAEIVQDVDEGLADLLSLTLGHLEALGAENNDVLSALAHWASLPVSLGVSISAQRSAAMFKAPLSRAKHEEIALNVFLQDLIERVAARRRETRPS